MSIVYSPFPNRETAEQVAKDIIEESLAACVNIWEGVLSLYPWEGEIKKDKEVFVWIKTTRHSVERVMAFLEKHHPYDLPCIIHIPCDASRPYLKWLESQVRMIGKTQ